MISMREATTDTGAGSLNSARGAGNLRFSMALKIPPRWRVPGEILGETLLSTQLVVEMRPIAGCSKSQEMWKGAA